MNVYEFITNIFIVINRFSLQYRFHLIITIVKYYVTIIHISTPPLLVSNPLFTWLNISIIIHIIRINSGCDTKELQTK